MRRTHVTLNEVMRARLMQLARASGRTVSELVREALQRTFGLPSADELERTTRAIEGLWRDRSELEDGAAYVRGLRRSTRHPAHRKD